LRGRFRGSVLKRRVPSGRSILCISLIASAAFIIVAVDAFKRGAAETVLEKKSGTGGFFAAESLLPLYHDPNTTEGREALNIVAQRFDPGSVSFALFRVGPATMQAASTFMSRAIRE
jgi:hypothetical protein